VRANLIIRDGDMENLPSVPSLVTYELSKNSQTEAAANDTTHSQIIITPTYMRLAQPKPNLT